MCESHQAFLAEKPDDSLFSYMQSKGSHPAPDIPYSRPQLLAQPAVCKDGLVVLLHVWELTGVGRVFSPAFETAQTITAPVKLPDARCSSKLDTYNGVHLIHSYNDLRCSPALWVIIA